MSKAQNGGSGSSNSNNQYTNNKHISHESKGNTSSSSSPMIATTSKHFQSNEVTTPTIMNRRSSNRHHRQNRREQALADAAQVRWDAQNNFNLCQVVITNKKSNHTPTFHLSPSHYNFDFAASTKDIASNLYDSVFHLQEDYEHSVDWDEVPYLQRECPSYLQNLDMSDMC